jgi:hypothetical protein
MSHLSGSSRLCSSWVLRPPPPPPGSPPPRSLPRSSPLRTSPGSPSPRTHTDSDHRGARPVPRRRRRRASFPSRFTTSPNQKALRHGCLTLYITLFFCLFSLHKMHPRLGHLLKTFESYYSATRLRNLSLSLIVEDSLIRVPPEIMGGVWSCMLLLQLYLRPHVSES